jgi:preprotein translocase subunit SecA
MNFDSRKQLLDYDNVMNKQRLAVYQLRNLVLDGLDVTERVTSMIKESAEEQLYLNAAEGQAAALWNMEALNVYLKKTFGFALAYTEDELRGLTRPAAQQDIEARALEAYKRRTEEFAQRSVNFPEMQRVLLLQIIDHIWKNHLYDLDHLKKGVGLRAYGQKDPLIEYQKESWSLFETMLARVRDQMVEYIFRIQLPPRVAPRPPAAQPQAQGGAQAAAPAEKKPQNKFINSKTGRNDICPCGSGKKYKKCHGA